MYCLFYILVLSVHAIDGIFDENGNFVFNILDPAYLPSTYNKGMPPPEGRPPSRRGPRPGGPVRAVPTFRREIQASHRAEWEGPRHSPRNPCAADGAPMDVGACYEAPSASTGAVPRRYSVRQLVRRSPLAGEVLRCDVQFGAGPSMCPSCGINLLSDQNPEPSNAGNPHRLPRYRSSLKQFPNNSSWMPEAYLARDKGDSFDSSLAVRSNTTSGTQNLNEDVRNYLQSSPDNRKAEIKFCEDVSDIFPQVHLIDAARHSNRSSSKGGVFGPASATNLGTWPQSQTQAVEEREAGLVQDYDGFIQRLLTIDVGVGILAERMYKLQSEVLKNKITSDQGEFRRGFTELVNHVIRVSDLEFRLEPFITANSIDDIKTYLNSLIDDVEKFGMYFVHDTVTSARLKINEFQYHFRALKTICYELLSTPYDYTSEGRHAVVSSMFDFIMKAEELTQLLKDMLQALATHWEIVGKIRRR